MNLDLELMTKEQLKEETIKLRKTLRELRDRNGHDLCWYNPEIWEVLPEKIQPNPEVPEWCEFIKQCSEFRRKFDLQQQKI